MRSRWCVAAAILCVASAGFGAEPTLLAELKFRDYADSMPGNSVLKYPDAGFSVWLIDQGGCGDVREVALDLVDEQIRAKPNPAAIVWMEVRCQEESPASVVFGVFQGVQGGWPGGISGPVYRVPRGGTAREAEVLGATGCLSYSGEYNLAFVGAEGRITGAVCLAEGSDERKTLDYDPLPWSSGESSVMSADRIQASLIREGDSWSVVALLQETGRIEPWVTLSIYEIGDGGFVPFAKLKSRLEACGLSMDNMRLDEPGRIGKTFQLSPDWDLETTWPMKTYRRLTSGANATELQCKGDPGFDEKP